MRSEREIKAWEILDGFFFKSANETVSRYTGDIFSYTFKNYRCSHMEKVNEFICWCIDEIKKGFDIRGTNTPIPKQYDLIPDSVYWKGIRLAIFAYYNDRCYLCGCNAEELHHILPREMGGSNHPRNLIPLCIRCHKEVHRRLDSGIDFAVISSIQGLIKT